MNDEIRIGGKTYRRSTTGAPFTPKGNMNMMRVTRETKATLTGQAGRVVGFVKDTEPGVLSLAVPNDRAQLTPNQARALAAWLNETAAEIDQPRNIGVRGDDLYRNAERTYQESMRAGIRRAL